MRFQCDSCGAKYKIADERVSGRLLRFPCRKCDEKILINGKDLNIASPVVAAMGASGAHRSSAAGIPAVRDNDQGGRHPGRGLPIPQPSLVPASRGDAIWHASIADVPVGPLTVAEVSQRIHEGALNEYSLVWQQSFDEWRPLATVPELMTLLQRRRASMAPRGTFTSIPPAEELRESQLSTSRPPADPTAPTAQHRRMSDRYDPQENTVVAPMASIAQASQATSITERSMPRQAPSQSPSEPSGAFNYSQPPIDDLSTARTPAPVPPSAYPLPPRSRVPARPSHPGAAYSRPPTSSSHSQLPAQGSHPGAAYSRPPATGSHPGASHPSLPAQGSQPGAAYAQPPTSVSYPNISVAQPLAQGSYPGAAYAHPPQGSNPNIRPSQPGMFSPSSPGFVPPQHVYTQPPMAPIQSQPVGNQSGSFPGIVLAGSAHPSSPGMAIPLGSMHPSVPGMPAVAPQSTVPLRAESPGVPWWAVVIAFLLLMIGFMLVWFLVPRNPAPAVVTPPAAPQVAPPAAPSVSSQPDPTADRGLQQEFELPEVQGPAATEPTPQQPRKTTTNRRNKTTAQKAENTAAQNADDALLRKFEGSDTAPAKIDTKTKTSRTTRKQLDAAAVRSTVSKNQRGLQRCYERSLRGQAMESAIRVDVVVKVGRSGKVTSAKATARGPAPGGLTSCVESRVRRWKFPASADGGPAKFPVVFQPKG